MRVFKITFTVLFLSGMFIFFQNFGFITNLQTTDVQTSLQKNYNPKKYVYDPNKSLKHVEEFYRKNVVFVETDESKYFDHKKFVKEKWKETTIYNRLKNWVEVSDSELEEPSRGPASEVVVEELNSEDVKVKIDPLKARAMLRYMGTFRADIAYEQDDSNIQVKVYKDLDANSQIHLQHDANAEKTWVQYQFNW